MTSRLCTSTLPKVYCEFQIVSRVNLSSFVSHTSSLQYVVADYAANGQVFIYVSDAAERALIVVSVTSNTGYRMILPKALTFGCTEHDVLYIALIRSSFGTSYLIFTYLSGTHLFSIETCYLHSGWPYGQITDLGDKNGKVVLLGTDNRSAVFFRMWGKSVIYRWDLLGTCSEERKVVRVYEGSEHELSTHVVVDSKHSQMRVLQTNFPDYFQGNVGAGATHAVKMF